MKDIDNIDQRIVKLAVFAQNQLLFIKLENYYVNQIKIVDGNYISTKGDSNNHGYGIKSIKAIIEVWRKFKNQY